MTKKAEKNSLCREEVMLSDISIDNYKIKLQFPLNNGGQEVGISEGGIEHFTGKLVESLCKEILQNSLDARESGQKVKVKFELIKINKKFIPEIDSLIRVINSCLDYWKGNSKTCKILKKSLESIQNEEIEVLRISDYGTCGLTGSKKERNSNFFNLVKSSGTSSKGGQAGGSFGIGKFAPFACSYPRTIFYSTLDKEGNYAFQGVSRLVTHKLNEETTQGVGYIGNPNGNKPVLNKSMIPDNFLRREIGTDINIIGFNGKDNWKESVMRASLNSFFESIYEGKLEIQVENEVINKSNFQKLGEKHLSLGNLNDYTYEYFTCITSDEGENKRVFKEDFIFDEENFGEIELHLYKERKFNKKVAYLRSTGMKIIDKGNFRTALQFAGVLKLKGEKINSFIRSLETPSHDNLETGRHDNPKYAKKVLDSLNKLIREKVGEFSKLNDGEELDIKGLSRFLPDSSKENEILNFSLKNGKIKSITQEKYDKKNNRKNISEKDGHIEEILVRELDSGNLEGGNTGPENEGNTITLPSENDNSDPTNSKNSEKSEEGNKSEILTEQGKKKLYIVKRKALINDNHGKRYKVILQSLEDSDIFFHLKALYEDGKGEVVEIERSYTKSREELEVNENKYVSVNLKANEKKILYVDLNEEMYSSMEVLINAK